MNSNPTQKFKAVTPQYIDILRWAVQRYTERIHLVQQAMRELRPVMLSGVNLKTASHEEIVEYCEKLNAAPWSGFWRDRDQIEWRYSFHGGGLRLIQTETKEPLDWDADTEGQPDLDAFDRWFFGTWFEWYLSSRPELKAVFPRREAFEHLITQGLLSKHGQLYKVARP